MDKFKSKRVFVEAESRRIGRVMIPQAIHHQMKTGRHIFIERDINQRVAIIKKDYTARPDWKEESIKGMQTLSKYMQESKINELIEELKFGDVDAVIAYLMLNYYDPMYMNKSDSIDYDLKIDASKTIEATIIEIMDWINE